MGSGTSSFADPSGVLVDVITEIPPSEEFADSMLTTVALLAGFVAPAYAHHGTEPSGSSNAAPAADTYQDLLAGRSRRRARLGRGIAGGVTLLAVGRRRPRDLGATAH